MRYFTILRYDGSSFYGWQKQNGRPTVQGTLETTLSTLLQEPVPITGAGRTDTGVHASFYVAHFDYNGDIRDIKDLIYHWNCMLPCSIAINDIFEVVPDAHARYDATEREYTYYISKVKDPFKAGTSWLYTSLLDVEKMNRAAALLLQEEDFTTFSKLHSNNKTNICRVNHAEWTQADGQFIFTIRSDRFLRNMVRAITGTLVDVGRGKINVDRFGEILSARDRSGSSGSAPAQGLFLSDIKYPYFKAKNIKTLNTDHGH